MSNTAMANTAQALMDSMTPKFAVSYLRVSTRGQAERGGGHDEGFSIPAQREANKKKALSMGAMVGKEFVDRGASAKSADRPQLQAMLEYVKENADRVDYVIVHKVDRLARNRDDDSDIMRVLRECGVQLVSASESIDDTPAGMLLHGIMSSIAEFYSQNLATEVKKGMGEKIKSGGTVGRAPIGYQNVRYVDEKGREERTVITDPERAPLIKLAFEEYATGNWTVADLADHLAACGLNTRSTPKIPSQPITLKTLHKVLVNPYYKGIVKYKGIEYDGTHEKLVDAETWDMVQSILASRLNGERNLKHPHFLKGSLYCAYCGERIIVSNEKKKNGTVYPYFVCGGRHSKRRKDCKTRAVLIDVVEKEIERIYDNYQLPSEIRILLESRIQEIIAEEKKKYNVELDGLKGEKAKLENKRKKLLEAHYNDAIPLDLLKSEQQKIAKELANIEHEIKMHNTTFDQITQNLKMALDIVEDCAGAYRNASDTIKKLMNQAIFEKFYISNTPEESFSVEATFKPPFKSLLEPIRDDISRINKATRNQSSKLRNLIVTTKGHIQEIFECGLSAVNYPSDMSTSSNDSNFFEHKSSSKVFLVDLSQLYSNPFLQIRSFKQRIDPQISAHSSEPLTSEDKLEAIENISPKRLNVYGETEVCRIRQKQKVLSDIEIQTVCKRYRSGDSVYKLAKDFECHRSTISAVLKRNGVEVTHLASKKPELVKKVIELYAERKDSIF